MRALIVIITFTFAATLGAALVYNAEEHKNVTEIAKDRQELTELIEKIGVAEVMNRLVLESGGGSEFDCHQDAHDVGRIGYTLHKEKTFESCDANCHSGCYHGTMEEFLADVGTANLAEEIDGICSKFETSFGLFECLHGVGHGLLAYLNYDLPATIAECDRLKDRFSAISCYGGMFMENIVTGQGIGASKSVHATEWLSDDPHFPCNEIGKTKDLLTQCYQMQTSWMLYLNGYDFGKVAIECTKVPTDMVAICFKSYGRDAAGTTLRDPYKIIELCEGVPDTNPEYYKECLNGGLNVVVDFWGPNLEGQAVEVCKLTQKAKEQCYATLAWRIEGLTESSDKIKEWCEQFEVDYKKLCGII
ncbi:MAG: hypothetical protein HYS87_03190 [Candidatus Colwellbacteria bacterium]|nr:hypothetical protein [Candidatus Colwellbacteria bacterium]